MSQPQISVIMPAYNAGQWLLQAVESVLRQTGPAWELLIIDDGSHDGTRRTAERYAALDPRVRVLDNANAKGTGGARNTGFMHARGRAIMFLDSDDILLCGAIEGLHGLLNAGDAPVVRGLGLTFCSQRWLLYATDPPTADASVTLAPEGFPTKPFWLHMYSADFLQRHELFFPEDLSIGEDTAFLCTLYPLLRNMPVLRAPVHLYRINHKPVASSAADALSFVSYLRRARESFERLGRGEWVVPYLERTFLSQWLMRLHDAMREGESARLEYLRQCAALVRGLEPGLGEAVHAQLGNAATAFWDAVAACDPEGMLAAVGPLAVGRPDPVYGGITRATSGLSWQAYRLLRRALSVATLPETRKALAAFRILRSRATRRLQHSTRDGQ